MALGYLSSSLSARASVRPAFSASGMLRQVGLINGNMYWLGRPNLALLSVIAVHAWRLIPLAAVIMMAGLVAIPNDIKEQAEVDGGGYWRRMFEITIPLMMPLIAVERTPIALLSTTFLVAGLNDSIPRSKIIV